MALFFFFSPSSFSFRGPATHGGINFLLFLDFSALLYTSYKKTVINFFLVCLVLGCSASTRAEIRKKKANSGK